MPPTQIRGEQILDGSIDAADIDDALEKELTKVRTTANDSTSDFLSSKLVAGSNIVLNVLGSSGSNQTLSISSTATSGDSFGARTHLVVDGGSYATIQAAYDAASAGDVILVGHKASGNWGNLALGINKSVNISALSGPGANKNVEIGSVTFDLGTTGSVLNVIVNEVYISGLYINGSFSGSAVTLTGGTNYPGRLRLYGCYVLNSHVSGSAAITNSNLATNSSIYLDSCIVSLPNSTVGSAIVHSGSYTLIRNRTDISGPTSGAGYGINVLSGTMEIYDSNIQRDGAVPVINITGGSSYVSAGYSTIKNSSNSAGAACVYIGTSGASFGAGDATLAAGSTLPTSAVVASGVAGANFLYTNISYSYATTVSTVTMTAFPQSGGVYTHGISVGSMLSKPFNVSSAGTVTAGVWNGTAIAVANGGTGATTAANARTNLGLAIGSNVQAYSAPLNSISAGTWTGANSITTLGTITTGLWSGSAIPVTNGGTGASTSASARTNLGLAIGTDVQGYSANLQGLAGVFVPGIAATTRYFYSTVGGSYVAMGCYSTPKYAWFGSLSATDDVVIMAGNSEVIQFDKGTGTIHPFSASLTASDLGTAALPFRNIRYTGQLTSTVAIGTSPFVVTSTTEVANLNASRVAGKVPTAVAAANALPLADATGRLDAAWIPPLKTQTLSDGSGTISWDMSLGTAATVTLTGTGRTFAAPTNIPSAGTTGVLVIVQDGVGSRTITSWDAKFKWPGGTAITLTTTATKRDFINWYSDGTLIYMLNQNKNY